MKERRMIKTALSAAILATLVGCASQGPAWEKDKTYHLTVISTNDHHGHFWANKYGEYGLAARRTLVDQIRKEVEAEGGSVLLLSAGDINTGVPESDLQDAEPDIKGMNLMGYDAMTLGNHEFDNSLDVLDKQINWAEFPMLSANIYDKATGERKYQPYQIFDKQGVKIAVIGLTTEDTAKLGNPEFISSLDFRDPKEEVQKVVADLEQTEKPDLIFVLSHMGYYEDGKNGVNAPGDVAMARYVNEGTIDYIVGGHSHDPVCMDGVNTVDADFKPGDECKPDMQNGTWIAQSFEWGKFISRADFTFQNGELDMVSYDLIPVNLKKKIKVDGKKKRVLIEEEIAQDPEMLALLEPYQNIGQDKLNVKVASVNGDLIGERSIVRFQQTNLGRLIATAHMERAKADFAVMNSGGVRASIEQGDVTYKDILTVQPFGNMVTYTDMTGKDVMDYLKVVATKSVDSGAYAQFAGISMTVDGDTVSDVKIGGEPIDMSKTYRFTVPSYNAAGGDGYPKLTSLSGYVNTGFVDAEVLKAYMESNSPLDVSKYEPKGEMVYK